MPPTAKRKAVIIGATGLVGSRLLALLLEDKDFGEIHAFLRGALPEHPKLRQSVMELSQLETAVFPAADAVFCCLGTTLRRAGSREAFRKVDFDATLAAARRARAAGCRIFLLVTARGANPESRIFYNRVKGEIETAVRELSFPSLVILRPGLLLGARSESRPLESLAQAVLGALKPLLIGPLSAARPIAGETVARAMHAAAKGDWKAPFILEGAELEVLGAARRGDYEPAS